MTKQTKDKIWEAIESLNACYGRGDVRQVVFNTDSNGGVFEYQTFGGYCRWQHFTLGRRFCPGGRTTVKALGHQRTIKTPLHWKALEKLRGDSCKLTGEELWRRLRELETKASNAATAQCNAADYGGEPYRDPDQWDEFCNEITDKVTKLFGRKRRVRGFFINGDPRGYALKISGGEDGTDKQKLIPAGMHKDWGGEGCLAAEIN